MATFKSAAEAIKALTAWHMDQVGYLEKKNGTTNYLYDKTANAGSANYTKYGYEMHKIQPSNMDYPAAWCDAYFDNGMVNVFGVAAARLLLHDFDDWTVRSAELYKQRGEWTTTNPREGDQIFFKNSGGICHTGYVYANDGVYVYTVEGNTSGASGVVSNGGGVAKKKYLLSYANIAGYGRPNYEAVFGQTHWAEPYYNKLKAAGKIHEDCWTWFDCDISAAHAVALIDAMGGHWRSDEENPATHWAQPAIISLCGKRIITARDEWIARVKNGENLSNALALALADNASGGMKSKYVGRKTDHWGRNCLDSLCDKVIVTTPSAWTNFEGACTYGRFMALMCAVFHI